MGVELPLCVVVTILEYCVTFSGVKLSIRSFVLFQMIANLRIICLAGPSGASGRAEGPFGPGVSGPHDGRIGYVL